MKWITCFIGEMICNRHFAVLYGMIRGEPPSVFEVFLAGGL